MSAHDRRRGGPRGAARPPRHWIKRPPRPSRQAPSAAAPPRPGARQLLIAVAVALVTGFTAAYVAAHTLPRPEMTMMALGLGGALGGALAWRAQGGRFGPR
ncbi:hypothetical protein [Plastoroseomonas hellenica]|uniref:Uncharacterized protein n=1 Tax=Plastoroseomonas hellenica TaxID=2687306 RepID=A0ABS5EZR4_9PROT|nr:hypothetical protein [Plastoroseomonas hellenica]MBR0643485.1 hypothetical protein [Plastoroseomonas hellenica]MBR0665776.1 hypothetical protein [Plastoroseomonas hellenica]